MSKRKPTKPLSQAEKRRYRTVLNDSRIDLPWRERAVGSVLPCEDMPLCGSVCGVSSAAFVLSTIRGETPCPLNRPDGCPFGDAPNS